jgi:hypothetical protein
MSLCSRLNHSPSRKCSMDFRPVTMVKTIRWQHALVRRPQKAGWIGNWIKTKSHERRTLPITLLQWVQTQPWRQHWSTTAPKRGLTPRRLKSVQITCTGQTRRLLKENNLSPLPRAAGYGCFWEIIYVHSQKHTHSTLVHFLVQIEISVTLKRLTGWK